MASKPLDWKGWQRNESYLTWATAQPLEGEHSNRYMKFLCIYCGKLTTCGSVCRTCWRRRNRILSGQ